MLSQHVLEINRFTKTVLQIIEKLSPALPEKV